MLGATRRAIAPFTDALAAPFVALRIPPTAVTLLALVPAAFACYLAGTGHWGAAVASGVAAGLLDVADGAVARRTNRVTAFGGFLDSVLDRVVDAAFLVAVGFGLDRWDGWALVGAALIGSYGTSYARARAHEAGGVPPGGWNQFFERGERLIVLGLGALVEQYGSWTGTPTPSLAMLVAVAIVAAGSLVTMLQRILLVRRTLATR